MPFLRRENDRGRVFDVRFHLEKRKNFRFLRQVAHVVDLKPTLFRKYQFWVVAGVFLVAVLTIGLNEILTRAEVSEFFPSTCLGTWQNPEKAQGRTENFGLSAASTSSVFNEENSAVQISEDQKIYCGQFVPDDYLGTGEITDVALTLVWDVSGLEDREPILDEATSSQGGSSDGSEELPADENGLNKEMTPETEVQPLESRRDFILANLGLVSVARAQEAASSASEVISEPAAPTEPIGPTESTVSTTSETSSQFDVIDFQEIVDFVSADGGDVQTTSAESISVTTEPGDFSEGVLPETPVSADAGLTEDGGVSDRATVEGGDLGVPVEEIILKEEFVEPPRPADENFLSVKYSLDGQIWTELVRVGPFNWKNLTVNLPIKNWEDLRKLQISVEGLLTTLPARPSVFLDGMLLGVNYDKPPILPPREVKIEIDPVAEVGVPDNLPFEVLPFDDPSDNQDSRKEFGPNESPIFDFDLDKIPAGNEPSAYIQPRYLSGAGPEVSRQKRGGFLAKLAEPFLDFVGLDFLARADDAGLPSGKFYLTENDPIVAQVVDGRGAPTEIRPIFFTINNKLRISIPEPKHSFKPGKYKLKLWVLRNNSVFFSETSFVWGVLAINFDKSIYRLGDTAKMGLAVLNDSGHTVCDAAVRVRVAAPGGGEEIFSTRDGSLSLSQTCGPDNVTDEPDYQAFFGVTEEGKYKAFVTVFLDGETRGVEDGFEVQAEPLFEIQRLGATRIFPPEKYQMTLRVKTLQDFKGEIKEIAPEGFEVTPETAAAVSFKDGFKEIRWGAELAAGEVRDFSYVFDAPDVSPFLYKLGPAEVFRNEEKIFSESRAWQIASDAVTNDGSILVYSDAADDDNLNARVLTSTSTFGAEGTTVDVTANAADVVHARIVAAPTRNEFISAHQATSGELFVLKRNGSSWIQLLASVSSSAAQSCDTTKGSCEATFDVAYEQLSGEAVVFYGKTGIDNAGDIFYRTWDGNASSSEGSFDFYSASPGCGLQANAGWVRAVPRGDALTDQRSDEIMILVKTIGCLFGLYWDGTQIATSTLLEASLNSTERNFDGAWESVSGNFLAVYGDSAAATTTPYKYKIWSGGAWGSENNFATMNSAIPTWAVLASDPLSNRIAAALTFYSSAGTGRGRSAVWKGDGATASWTLGLEDTAMESEVAIGTNAAWERFGASDSTSTAMFTYIDNAGTGDDDSGTWTPGGGFAATSSLPGGWGNDAGSKRLVASPNDDELMYLGIDSDHDLQTQRWDGANWRAAPSGEFNTAVCGTWGNAATVRECDGFDFAYKPYSPWSLNWRWYDGDSTADTPSPALANENVSSTVTGSTEKLRLRFNVAELGGNSQTDSRKKLQYTTSSNPNASSTEWTDVGNVGSSTSVWRYFDADSGSAIGDDGGVVATAVLSSSTVAGWWTISKDEAASSSMDHASTTVRELEFAIEGVSAPDGLYYFRMYDVGQRSPVYRQQTSWPSTPCAGNLVCTYPSVTVTSVSLSVSGVILNGGVDIVLTPYVTTTITLAASSTGSNLNFATGTISRSGVGFDCSSDDLSCYQLPSSSCVFAGASSSSIVCTADLWYFADATDASSSYPSQTWQGRITLTDTSPASYSSSTVSGVELRTMVAVEVSTSSINYGTIAPSSTTGLANQVVGVKNVGNASTTLKVSGTALSFGLNSVVTSSQHYATTTFSYGGSEPAISDTATTIANLTLNKRVTSSTNPISSWAETTALPVATREHVAIAHNNYLYSIGGFYLPGGATSTVNYSTIASDGTIGAWSTTTALPATRYRHAGAVYNGFVYLSDGVVAGATSSVIYAAINANGTLGSWQVATPLPVAKSTHSMVAGTNGYMYVIGGVSGVENTSTVLYAPINTDGSLGSWAETTALPGAAVNHQTLVANGYLFNIPSINGDSAPTATSTVVAAKLNQNGTVGNWTETTALPWTLFQQGSVVVGDVIYNLGGYADSTVDVTSTVTMSTITGGSVGTWRETSALPFKMRYHRNAVTAWKGFIYLVGGNIGTGTSLTSTVRYGFASSSPSYGNLFWGVGVTAGKPTGTYSGVNTLNAVFSE